MQIPKEILNEKNYEGTRLIEITNEKVLSLLQEVKKLKDIAAPHLEEMEKLTPPLDKIYGELRPLEEKRVALKAELAEKLKPFNEQQEKLDVINQKSDLIKNKMYPIARDVITKELGEFEMGGKFIEKEGKVYVEIIDQLEEKIKEIRKANANKPK